MRVLLCWLVVALVSARTQRRGKDSGNNDNSLAYKLEQAFNNYSLSYTFQDPPSELLRIRFGVQEALLGTQLCAFVTLYYPFFSYNASPRSLNTLCCFNPDVGFYFKGSYDLSYLITLVVNIPGENVYSGDTVIDFKTAPSPPGAGPTRNVCLVYKQNRKIDISTELLNSSSKNLNQFNITDFTKRYRLYGPYAGNFFLTQVTLCESNGNGCIQNNCGSGFFC